MLKNGKRLKKLVCSFLLIAGCLVPAINGRAADTGSIKISYHGRTDEETIALSKTPFVLYYAGFWNDGEWKLSEEFQEAGVSLKNGGASERKKQAERLYAYAVNEKLQGTEQETDEGGLTAFENLEKGLYLIAQTREVRKGKWLFRSSPFLVSVPGDENGAAIWDIVTEPKSEWTEVNPGGSDGGGSGGGSDGGSSGGSEGGNPDIPGSTEPETTGAEETESTPVPTEITEGGGGGKTPKTGDSSSLDIWLILLVISAGMTGAIYWRIKHPGGKEHE